MVGQNIGKYRVLDRIGRGGMGTVYKAIDETLHREVAIKVLNTDLNDPAIARRFRAEAVTVARLNHPGIATIFELFQHDGEWLMVMEFVRGETLEALVARKGALTVGQAADICMQVLAALAHAHGLGVVHRDLKPANVMVAETGNVKIMDFGIARVVGTEHLTSAGFMLGTPAYMAPEQVLGKDIDARADLYAIGVVLFYLLTTKLPFKGHTPFEMAQSRLRDDPMSVLSVRADLPPWLDQVLALALRREPEQRHQSAPIFREALRRGLENLPQETDVTTAVLAELVATAPPGSMRTPAPAVSPELEIVQVAMKPAATAPSQAEPAPVASPSSTEAPPRRSVAMVALAAAVVIGLGLGAWAWIRSGSSTSGDTPAAPAATAPEPVAGMPADPPPAAVATPSNAPVAPPSSAPSAAPAPPPAATPGPTTVAATEPGRSVAPPARGPGSPERSTSAADPTRGAVRGAPGPEVPVVFKDLRLLVVAGKNAEERAVNLNLGDGRVVAANSRDGTAISSMPYGEVLYAVYVRAKDPKWSVVLAAPPPDLDLPGFLFRSARHWLVLQSRAAYMIIRLNDNDWRQVVDVVANRTGVTVEEPAGSR